MFNERELASVGKAEIGLVQWLYCVEKKVGRVKSTRGSQAAEKVGSSLLAHRIANR